MTIWAISLLLEVALLGALWDRGTLLLFRVYLSMDIIGSVGLYAIAMSGNGPIYDVTWRMVQLGLLAPRAAVAMDIYRSLSATRRFWRFSDATAIPIAGCAALLFRLVQDVPLRWPWSSLEQVFIAVATFNTFLSMLIITILTAEHRHSLMRTEDFWHGTLFAAYLAITAVCYFGAAHYPGVQSVLMWTAVSFYGLRLLLSVARFSLVEESAV